MTPEETTEKIQEIREILTPPGAWTQNMYSRNSAGERVSPESPNAVCWCVSGAIYKVIDEVLVVDSYESNQTPYGQISDIFHKAIKKIQDKYLSFISWQDQPERTHEEVLHLIDTAIEISKGTSHP